MPSSFNTLTVAHRFLEEHIQPGSFCIDATAGRGNDTLLLCRLVGETGQVLAFDIQPQAVESTLRKLDQAGLSHRARVMLESHVSMDQYAAAETVDGIVFNFGYLPGGDHQIHTLPLTSIQAIQKGLTLLKPGGVMSLCIYYGGDTGFEEKEALLDYLETLDSKCFTVLVCTFHNRPNCPPIPVLITKDASWRGEKGE